MGNIIETVSRGMSSTSGSLSASYPQVGSAEQLIDTILAASSSNVAVAGSFLSPGTSSGDLVAIELLSSVNMTVTTNLTGSGTADVQTVSISGTPTGGTFALAFNGVISAPIAYNASAATVQSALQALSNIGSGNLTCTGGPLPGTAVVCSFAGTLAIGRQSVLTAGSGGLTGGTSPTASVAHTTPGTPQDTISLTAGIPFQWDTSMGLTCPFAAAVISFYVTCTSAGRLQGRILTY